MSYRPFPRLPSGRDPTGPPRSGARLPRRPPAQAVLVPILGLAAVAVGLPFHAEGPGEASGLQEVTVTKDWTFPSGFPGLAQGLRRSADGPMIIVRAESRVDAGGDPGRPPPNTVAEVRQAYQAGAPVVEVNLQMTSDGEVIVWHDDVLSDLTCISNLTRGELVERLPDVYGFPAVLEATHRFNRASGAGTRGLLAVSLAPASPRCDPADTVARDEALVEAVVAIVRQLEATDVLFLSSTSPILLELAAEAAPEIPRQLTVGFLQFLNPQQVEADTGIPVAPIRKEGRDHGLAWWELGGVHRLPAYSSPLEALEAATATGSSMISYDLSLLEHLERAIPGAAVSLVSSAQEMGFLVLAGQVSRPADWHLGVALGVDGLYTNDVALALSLQAPME